MNRDTRSILLGILGGIFFGLGWIAFSAKRDATPVAQPSVPSLIPPKCNGSCCVCRPQSLKPFSVVCPYCRNRLLATPPQTGEIGEVAKDESPE